MEPKKLEWKFYCSRAKTTSKNLVDYWGWKSESEFLSWIKNKFIQLPDDNDEIWNLIGAPKIFEEDPGPIPTFTNPVNKKTKRKTKKKKSKKKKEENSEIVDTMSLTDSMLSKKENNNVEETSN